MPCDEEKLAALRREIHESIRRLRRSIEAAKMLFQAPPDVSSAESWRALSRPDRKATNDARHGAG